MSCLNEINLYLTHGGLEKLADILQMTFSIVLPFNENIWIFYDVPGGWIDVELAVVEVCISYIWFHTTIYLILQTSIKLYQHETQTLQILVFLLPLNYDSDFPYSVPKH